MIGGGESRPRPQPGRHESEVYPAAAAIACARCELCRRPARGGARPSKSERAGAVARAPAMAPPEVVIVVVVAARESWVSESRRRFVADWARPAAAAAAVMFVCVGSAPGARVVVPPREATIFAGDGRLGWWRKETKIKGPACGAVEGGKKLRTAQHDEKYRYHCCSYCYCY